MFRGEFIAINIILKRKINLKFLSIYAFRHWKKKSKLNSNQAEEGNN